ncbi:MAG: SLC13 family permease [Bdellovibrionota bacterium]
MDMNQVLFIIIMVASIALFITDALRVDIVAVLIILALAITGLIDVKAAFSGFSSEPAIIVCAVFILSAGLSLTGATDVIGKWVGHWAGKTETRSNLVIMSAVATLSAFTHHLMVTAMMLPIVMKLCKEKGFHSSRLLIPMATAASLGTTLTLIGAPALLLANNVLQRSGSPTLSFFSPAYVGGPIVLISFLFILLSTWMLPKKSGADSSDDRFRLSDISTELMIPDESKWIGKTIGELRAETDKRFQIFSWFRNHRTISIHDDSGVLKAGDVFLVKTDADELVSIEERMGIALRAVKKFGSESNETPTTLGESNSQIFQAIVAPRSPFIGKSLSDLRFFERYGVVAVGLWRKTGWMKEEISDTPLKEGDLVVLWGSEGKFERLTAHRGFLMFMPFQGTPKKRLKMRLSSAIMFASIACAAVGLVAPHVAFVAGALAMVLTRCLSPEQAYDAVETKIFVMISGMIPLGIAMEKVGVDKLIANLVLNYTEGWHPFAMLLVFFWFAALLTQILSDAATTVLIAPIAVAFAKGADISPTAAVVVTTIGAVASFLTPIGHHGNLLILSPGSYRFSDFLKIGLPLTVIISLVTCFISMSVW